jgi:AbrB family looped-hinge helix DNA binding protein
MTIGTIDAKDRLRIPRELREALGLSPGDPVAYALVDGELRIRRVEDPYAHYGSVARQVVRYAEEHPEELLTHAQVMAALGVTQDELDALDDLDVAARGAA